MDTLRTMGIVFLMGLTDLVMLSVFVTEGLFYESLIAIIVLLMLTFVFYILLLKLTIEGVEEIEQRIKK